MAGRSWPYIYPYNMTASAKIRVAITDDHQIVIDGLAAALKNFSQIGIVATATAPGRMLELMQGGQPDVLITDVMMPGTSGLEFAQHVRTAFPLIRIIGLSMNGSGELVEQMAPFIDGYLLKQCSIIELVRAIEAVHAGGTYFDPQLAEERQRYRRSQQHIRDLGITPREKQIIRLLEQDKSSKEISAELFISIRTVETHRKNILRKTGTSNLLTLIQWAGREGLL
jgi:two-component system, NarL family, nitrate/nitrite response regulator NarL